jgi:hypothetical protein
MAPENYCGALRQAVDLNGGQRRDRTADAGLFKGLALVARISLILLIIISPPC